MNFRRIFSFVALLIILIWTIFPLYWFLIKSFMIPSDIASFPPSLYPKTPTLGAFYNIFGYSYEDPVGGVMIASGQAEQIKDGLVNSTIVSVIVTFITMLIVVPLAYTFGRLKFKHKNTLLIAVLLSVVLPPIATLIPFYILYVKFNLSGTIPGLIIVDLTITIPLVTWMLIGYFNNLPNVEKMAKIDGFSRIGAFLKIVVPMSKTGILVGAIIAFLFAWNEYTFAQLLVTGTPAVTLPAAISGFLFQHPEPEQLAASVFVSLIPPLITCYVLQGFISELHISDPLSGGG